MLKVCLFLLVLVVSSQAIPPSKNNNNNNFDNNVGGGNVDCDLCIQVMDEGINILLNVILNGGVIGGCEDLCHNIPNTALDIACNILCDYVGIKEFIKIINVTDPDPIWICQELSSCAKVNGGKVTISSISVSPSSGPIGTTFKINTLYSVLNATGPGLLAITITPPDNGEILSDAEMDYGQNPGNYNLEWDIKSDTNFTYGNYDVLIQICEGDCLNKHPYSGIYAQTNTNFTITK